MADLHVQDITALNVRLDTLKKKQLYAMQELYMYNEVYLVVLQAGLTLAWVNSKKVKWAARVQNILALTKVLALIMIIVIGMYYLVWGRTRNYEDVMAGTNWDSALIATAFYQTLFTYGGWGGTNVILEEVKDPVRNVPRAIAISLTSVTVIYVLTNIAYFAVLTPSQMLSSAAVAVVFGNLTMGVMAWTIPFLVACSTSGASNSAIFTNARVLFVSSRRGQMPRVLSHLHIHNHTPIPALFFVATITMVMFVTSDMIVLINYLSFATNLLELGTIGAFFWFRIKQPDRHRPIKVWIGFPIIYFIVSVFLTVLPVVSQPLEVMMAVVIIVTGLPVYYFTIHRQKKPQKLLQAMDKVAYLCQLLFLTVPEKTV
nr:Y+L amino acid transporter 2-like [Cherax quadricarinatus]